MHGLSVMLDFILDLVTDIISLQTRRRELNAILFQFLLSGLFEERMELHFDCEVIEGLLTRQPDFPFHIATEYD
jgi:hypothetical protein